MPRRECYSATHLPATPPPFPHAEKWGTGVISLSCLVGPGCGRRVLPTPQVGGFLKVLGVFFGGGGDLEKPVRSWSAAPRPGRGKADIGQPGGLGARLSVEVQGGPDPFLQAGPAAAPWARLQPVS